MHEEVSVQIAIYCIGKRVFIVQRLGPSYLLQAKEFRPTLSALCDSFLSCQWQFEKRNRECIWKTLQIK